MSTEKTWRPGLTDQWAEAVRTAEAGCTTTVTATAPIDPTGGDPVVMAIIEGCISHRIMFRARDGRWVTARDAMIGAWDTAELSGITRLTPETVAELMGGAS